MENRKEYIRQFVSFTGKCPYHCNHCYTFCDGYDSYDSGNTVKEVVQKLQGEDFDIVYISGHKENFINPNEGLELCEQLFDNFHTDLMVTTRSIFNIEQLDRFEQLNIKMREQGKDLFFCASIPALESYSKLEPNKMIPDPFKRVENMIRVFERGIYTFLTLRPLCPDNYIPIEEIIRIIELCKDHTTVILSSGIVVDEAILKRLEGFPKDFRSQDKPLMPCLKNNLSMKYVNVDKELDLIRDKAKEYNIAFFEHSLPAIEYIKNYAKFS